MNKPLIAFIVVFLLLCLLQVLAGCVETTVYKTTDVTVINYGDVDVTLTLSPELLSP